MTESQEVNWYSNDAATFGDRVAFAREAQGMDQKSLARRLGVMLKTIEAWEHDISEPRANKLQTLSGVLNVSIPWLLTGEGQGPDAAVDTLAQPAELKDLMAEMRVLRTDMLRSAERLGRLEKRLKEATAEPAE